MKKYSKKIVVLVAIVQIFAITLLAGCNVSTPLTVCHATGDATTPYEKITVTSAELKAHIEHPNDIIPAPVGGCPTAPVVIDNGNITICHVTSSKTSPYDEAIVSVNGLAGHGTHVGDIIPMPAGGCPTSLWIVDDGKITICHATGSEKNPYNEITISVNGLSGHDKHEGDIIPVPAGGCPAKRQ